MKIRTLKQVVTKNIEENISLLIEVLDMYEHENKTDLKKLFEDNKELIDDVVFNVLMIYSLLSFLEDKQELEIAKENLNNLIIKEPLVKDIISIYLNIINIEDINSHISDSEAQIQNNKLVDILTSFN